MKKITNNTLYGRLTMILNLLVGLFIVISVIALLRFDKVNTQLQNAKPGYNNMLDSLKRVEQVIGDFDKKIANSQEQMANLTAKVEEEQAAYQSTIKDKKADAKAKEEAKGQLEFNQNQLKSFEEAIKSDSEQRKLAQDTLAMFQKETQPVIDSYKQLEQEVETPRTMLNTFVIITICLFLCKVVLFAYWSFLNMKNLRVLAPWMKKSTPPWLAIAAWFIPIYNLGKPCSIFYEMWDETNYVLKDRGIISDLNDDSQMEMVGGWWGLYLVAKCLIPFVIGGIFIGLNFWLFPVCFGDMFNIGTFFGTKGMFIYFNHTLIAVLAIIIWLAYVLYECYLIREYNKKNQMLVDNVKEVE